ncbi:EamA family transporter [Anaerobacillus alkaliphilus]|uniref:EamA family transporter n=1 Tax=Anaerobacillus alkaliphilus TaxID=1548597 RepID=A0A4Q0VXZ4_9BACI|nr:EamA family transporter [Anaerobacillus alkaliphilus]RXJ04282.1 EamA family transporter [Anaerobacillus alkaliphilus]
MKVEKGKLRFFGIVLVLLAAVFWGVSGTVAQYLFQEHGVGVSWLVVIRLLVSGLLILLITMIKRENNIWAIWKDHWFGLILFGTLGLLAVQYTYFAAIEASNAATATLLQYLAPAMIVLYVALKMKSLPSRTQFMAIGFALVGTFLLVTHGNFRELSITGWALFWGIASALALAFYTLQPIQLLKKYGSFVVVGWGMIIGGIGMSFLHPPWRVEGNISVSSITAISFVIVFGTLLAFLCYLESLKYLKATEASLLACTEPLSAALLAVLWLNVPFGFSEWLGAFCIIATIVILSRIKDKREVPFIKKERLRA